ncbi:M28 family peptidase [Pseudonocardia kujensis]|uniref:M28 family peptidase n=1 Tax=Pseudonocardia kujensis TaxID=1128675 RepID=UPI001E2BD699|nr:M28 family peptidase [Pseudonocardia kujensis]MCE0767146.1 M28 family peptidase [Pseudonocardia kujensis]
MRTGVAALLAGLAVACSAAAPTSLTPVPSAFADQLVAQVSGDGTFARLGELQRIADANGGNRATGRPGYDASVDHVAEVLRAAGFDVTTPSFTFRDTQYRNVVAQTRTGDPGQVLLAGAHLDSVRDGPGINDNGTGVATLLEIATRMGGSPPVGRAVRFAFWGAEERDFEGSQGYVDSLSAADRRTIALYLNLDMTASPNAGYFVQGDEPASRDLAARLTALGAAPDTMKFDGTSDYAAFVDAGIPGAGLLAGDEQIKTAEQAAKWGGSAGQVFDGCYHTACDTLDNVDRTALDRFGDATAGTLASLAGSPA